LKSNRGIVVNISFLKKGAFSNTLPNLIQIARIRRSLLLAVLLLGATSLTMISIGRERLWMRANFGHSALTLDDAVSRILLADEMAIDNEVEKATRNFDLVMNVGQSEAGLSPPIRDIRSSANKIKGYLVDSNRKGAMEEAVEFRKKIESLDKGSHPTKREPIGTGADWPFMVGIIGLLTCLGLLGVNSITLRRDIAAGRDAEQRACQELAALNSQFEGERRRTSELQKRLIGISKVAKIRQAEAARAVNLAANLDAQLESLQGAIGLFATERKTFESDVTQKNLQITELKAHLKTLLNEAEILSQHRDSERQATAGATGELTTQKLLWVSHEKSLIAQLEESRTQARQAGEQAAHTLAEQTALWAEREKAISLQLENSRVDARNIKVSWEADHVVLEWSNKKLLTQNAELVGQVAGLKAELLSEAIRFRELVSSR
jgi:hypothetical protein